MFNTRNTIRTKIVFLRYSDRVAWQALGVLVLEGGNLVNTIN